jgi:uncharacterized coiled-coil protein SlyX
MKIVLELAANSFYLSPESDPRLKGVLVKSRCNNSMSPNQIILEIPEGVIVEKIKEIPPEELTKMAELSKEIIDGNIAKDNMIEILNEKIEAQAKVLTAQEDVIKLKDAQLDKLSARVAELEDTLQKTSKYIAVDTDKPTGDQG